jgi:hypothetical protein
MRLPRLRFTMRRMMIAVAIVALILPSAIWFWKGCQNLSAYLEWAGNTIPTRPPTWHAPYPSQSGR